MQDSVWYHLLQPEHSIQRVLGSSGYLQMQYSGTSSTAFTVNCLSFLYGNIDICLVSKQLHRWQCIFSWAKWYWPASAVANATAKRQQSYPPACIWTMSKFIFKPQHTLFRPETAGKACFRSCLFDLQLTTLCLASWFSLVEIPLSNIRPRRYDGENTRLLTVIV